MSGQKRRECDFFVHFFAYDSNTFSHGKGSEEGADAEAFQMSQTEKRHAGGDQQTDNVERDLNFRITDAGDLGKFPWEKVRRDNRHLTAVGDGDAERNHKIADDEIQNPQRQCCRQQINPHFMYINHDSKEKSHHKTEQIGDDKTFSHDHENSDEQSLENVCPGTQCQCGKHLGKSVGNA